MNWKANNIKVIFWDFDGVIINSNHCRSNGFKKVLENYPEEEVNKLLEFHNKNGGLSRYIKFRYFFETIRKENIIPNVIEELCNRFSEIMKSTLTDPSFLNMETVLFIQNYYKEYSMYIVSGSDEKELRWLCQQLKIDKYFKGIFGSPEIKTTLIKQIIIGNEYSVKDCVLIGDSQNDYEAASSNNVDFLAYNNKALQEKHPSFIP